MDKLNGLSHTNGYNYDSGCTELNKKIKEWLKWDLVCIFFTFVSFKQYFYIIFYLKCRMKQQKVK